MFRSQESAFNPVRGRLFLAPPQQKASDDDVKMRNSSSSLSTGRHSSAEASTRMRSDSDAMSFDEPQPTIIKPQVHRPGMFNLTLFARNPLFQHIRPSGF